MLARTMRDRTSRALLRHHPSECGRIAEETSRVFSKHSLSRWSTSSNPSPSSVSDKVFSSQPTPSDPSYGTNKFISWYLSVLDKRPILTKSATTCGIFGLADLTPQGLTMERANESETKTRFQRFDFRRTARMALAGLILNGPTLHLWFNFMSRILPSADFVSSIKKMLLGQTIYGPSLNSAFFSFNGAMQGESQSEIMARLKRDLLPTLQNGLFFWPVCDVLNFKFVPVHLQGVGPRMVSDLSHMKVNPFIFQQRRHYVQLRTNLVVADNSGAKRVQCIKVLKGAKANAAGLGDIIIASVKEALPRGKVKKGEVVTCVVVRAGVHCTRSDGSQIRFDDNAAVIINKAGEPLGTRVFGPVPHELREKNMLKILALAQHVT